MSVNKKTKKIEFGDDFSFGDNGGLNLTIGSRLGTDNAEKSVSLAPAEILEKENMVKFPHSAQISKVSKVTLQRQTAGRGGKTVTVVMLPKETAIDLEVLARDMRKGLGCGSRVEEGRILLQGDICDRAEEWLINKGVKRVVRGN